MSGKVVTEDKFDNLEDPAQHWVNLVVAYRKRDVNATSEILRQAKQSGWTQALWEEEIGPTELASEPEDWKENEGDTDEFE